MTKTKTNTTAETKKTVGYNPIGTISNVKELVSKHGDVPMTSGTLTMRNGKTLKFLAVGAASDSVRAVLAENPEGLVNLFGNYQKKTGKREDGSEYQYQEYRVYKATKHEAKKAVEAQAPVEA